MELRWKRIKQVEKDQLMEVFDDLDEMKKIVEGQSSLDEFVRRMKDEWDRAESVFRNEGYSMFALDWQDVSNTLVRIMNQGFHPDENLFKYRIWSWVASATSRVHIEPPKTGDRSCPFKPPLVFRYLRRRAGNPDWINSYIDPMVVVTEAERLLAANGWKHYVIRRFNQKPLTRYSTKLIRDIADNIEISMTTAREKLKEADWQMPLDCIHVAR